MNSTTEIGPDVMTRSKPAASVRIDRNQSTDFKSQLPRTAAPVVPQKETPIKAAQLAPFWALSGQVLGADASGYHGVETTVFLGMMVACALQVCVAVYQLASMFSSLPMTAIGQSLTFARF